MPELPDDRVHSDADHGGADRESVRRPHQPPRDRGLRGVAAPQHAGSRGHSPPNGVGAVRRLEALGPAIVEEIISYQRPSGYAYKLVSGAPVRDHVGTIELREAGTGTG